MKIFFSDTVEREIPKMSNDIQAQLSGLYSSIRTNRQQRRSFLSSILRLFSENFKDVSNWFFLIFLRKTNFFSIKIFLHKV